MATVAIAAWREGFRGIVPAAVDPVEAWRPERISERLRDPGYDERSMLVAAFGERIAGLIVCGPSRDHRSVTPEGELMALYVQPSQWRRGVGRALVAGAVSELIEAGHQQAIVWTLAESPRNIAFYEALGFVLDGGSQRRPAFAETLEVRLRAALPSLSSGDGM